MKKRSLRTEIAELVSKRQRETSEDYRNKGTDPSAEETKNAQQSVKIHIQ